MKPRRSLVSFAVTMFSAAALASLVACAAGAEGTGSDDDVLIDARRVDAPINPNIDAPGPPIDARIDAPGLPIDAPVSLPDSGFDLDGGIPGTCTTHAECGPGNCCFAGLMCIPGDPLPLPPPLDCLPS